MSTLLTLSQVSKTYARREQPAVADVSVNVSEGELIALIGHNGAGKTTFFNLAIGLLRPDRGSCDLGLPIEDVGWCPQRDIIDWSLTVRQNIELAVELRGGASRRALKCEIQELARMMELAPELDREAENLSGGQLRRAQIIRGLAGSPRLLLLDEPTAGLDPSGITTTFQYLRQAANRGAGIVVCTHDTSRFASYCDRVVAMKDGRIVADQTTSEFMQLAPASDDLWDAYTRLVIE